jgi:eukaryotic-like serine/threonine-protein kinase
MNIRAIEAAISDRYRLGAEIGRGGMAAVYRAEDVRHGRSVAVKVLDPELISVAAERFVREIRFTGQLSHPHILPLLDSGEVDGIPFYVMPLVGGESLRDRIGREGALPIAEAVRLATEVASALDYAHRQGVVHRDIKPENILLQDGHAMVADFGIAKALSSGTGGATITATGVAVGTPAYMAPEQVLAERDVDGRADIYALGCVLFEMITGAPPFHGGSAQAVMSRHAKDAVPSIRSVRPSVPTELERTVTRALAKTPADRFRSAAEFSDALGRAAGGSEAPPIASTIAPRRVIGFAAGAALLIAAGIGVNAWMRADATAGVSRASAAVNSNRLAVLPMQNLGADTNDAYFAAGMTDELISTLSDISGVQVMARGAVMPYAGVSKPLADIGRELAVASLIESTCRKEGNRLRIRVRLIEAATQEQRWTQQYDRELTDVFAIQRDVALRVAEALRITLTSAESRALDRLPTNSSAAYEAYLRGRILHYEPISPARLDSAINHLERAIALDGNFALAHAMLAKAYVTKLFRFEPGSRYRERAAREIDRAIALDSTLAEAYQARGDLAYTPEANWRYEDALRDYLHALSLKPGLASAHASLGSLLFHIGMPRESLRELRVAISLDPSDTFAPPRVGRALWYAQQFDSALSAFQRSRIPAEYALVLGYLGRERDGLAFLDSAARGVDADVSGDFDAARAVLQARLDRPGEAMAAIQRVESSRGVGRAHFHHAQFAIATAYARMGRKDEAVRWLDRAARSGMPAYELFANDPVLMSLGNHPGYQRLMTRERRDYEKRKALFELRRDP